MDRRDRSIPRISPPTALPWFPCPSGQNAESRIGRANASSMQTIAQLVVSGVMLGGVYAVMAIGLTLIFGVLKIVNFAHGEFLMLAMYSAWAAVSFMGLNAYA